MQANTGQVKLTSIRFISFQMTQRLTLPLISLFLINLFFLVTSTTGMSCCEFHCAFTFFLSFSLSHSLSLSLSLSLSSLPHLYRHKWQEGSQVSITREGEMKAKEDRHQLRGRTHITVCLIKSTPFSHTHTHTHTHTHREALFLCFFGSLFLFLLHHSHSLIADHNWQCVNVCCLYRVIGTV